MFNALNLSGSQLKQLLVAGPLQVRHSELHKIHILF
jgi:hypothetical protein